MSGVLIALSVAAVLGGLGFACWLAVKFYEAIVGEVMKGLWK